MPEAEAGLNFGGGRKTDEEKKAPEEEEAAGASWQMLKRNKGAEIYK